VGEKRRDDESIIADFPVDHNEPAFWSYCPHCNQRSVLPLDDTIRLRHSLPHFQSQARKLGMFLGDMGPPLVGQPDGISMR